MRIAVATGLYPPEIGGPATYSRLLETELPARGWEVVVVPFARVRRLPKVVRHLAYVWHLARARRGAAVLYALDPVSVGVPALCVARLYGVPFVLRVAGDYAWEQGRLRYGTTASLDAFQNSWRSESFRTRLLRHVEAFVAVRAVRVIVPSRYLAGIVQQWGVPPERIEVIPSTFSEPAPAASRSELRAQVRTRYGLSGFVVASAGRLVPWKGFTGLIEAFASLPEDGTLVLAGDGPERVRLEERAAGRGVARRVRFVGQLPQEELHALLLGADVFVLNTEYEGLSHVLLEAMARGTPVVTTPAGGNTEVVTDGESGLLVPVGNTAQLAAALRRLLDDEGLRERLAAGGRRVTARFGKGPSLTALAALLESMCTQP